MSDQRCEMTDLPTIMCAHCSGNTGDDSEIPEINPNRQERIVHVSGALQGYSGLPYYPPSERRASNVDGGRTCSCGQPCGDAFVCSSCADDIDRCLGDVPALVEDLDIAAARLDNVRSWPRAPRLKDSPSLLGKPVREWTFEDSDMTLRDDITARTMRILGRGRPDNPGPAAARDQLDRILVTAVAVVEPTVPGPHDPVTMSRWMLRNLQRIIHHPEAPGIVEQVTKVHDRCMRLVDNAPDRTLWGYCSVILDDGLPCDAPVSIPNGADVWTCECGTQYRVEDLSAARIDKARDSVLTMRELALISGKTVNAVKGVLRRRGIEPVGSRDVDGKQVATFRGADFLDTLTASA
ncbi:hypothetical protein [Propionimicrobium sp. PCR01-08-3]|uniref:hypothetical protein n=1 Tax=Propionimicrobium sp. PCR01-08-3 TaxID=3052086 RepID=UPI00255CB9D4|nr:hypothetical protein [Propionimicrobium sp. PCR01-08-3]WIY84321.1 hypothetical protein QQ658_15280 [Propionimicrobium sp. PCR01-08-3]